MAGDTDAGVKSQQGVEVQMGAASTDDVDVTTGSTINARSVSASMNFSSADASKCEFRTTLEEERPQISKLMLHDDDMRESNGEVGHVAVYPIPDPNLLKTELLTSARETSITSTAAYPDNRNESEEEAGHSEAFEKLMSVVCCSFPRTSQGLDEVDSQSQERRPTGRGFFSCCAMK
mmetsp:Transcript_25926/g.50737  ORF Transcript_25926/g.50737 Transcript_25926/m.50737 type:complete len:177 (-) Transcript_25926:109-639(-)